MIDMVIGGQFGSEGKGKVAYWLTNKSNHKCSIRTGGCNSGHTIKGKILRHLPCSALIPNGICILGAGSYINIEVLQNEIKTFNPILYIDEKASIVTGKEDNILRSRIGSTLSGTGLAVSQRVNRLNATLVKEIDKFNAYLTNNIYDLIEDGAVIEGSQGFGLSLLHSPYYPFCTSRDTTASGLLSEVGLSPKIVRYIYLVIRTYPIRVAGNSGTLPHETSWEALHIKSEYTSVTKNIRRVGYFDPEIVRLAIKANDPDFIVLNHLDYIRKEKRKDFVNYVEDSINRKVDYIGLNNMEVTKL